MKTPPRWARAISLFAGIVLTQAILYGPSLLGLRIMLPLGKGNQIESSAATYAGLIATLFMAPIAWCSRRHRSFAVGATAMILFSLAWSLNLPLLVPLLRLPLLNMMSHNRLVFVGSFFILCLAAIGLEVLWNGATQRRRWFWAPAAVVLGLAVWSI